jgi:DNA-directed RNA polymerase specialized sigma24 family protein
MRFMQGLSVAEVAERMNRSIGSIHMICHRALQQLREQVQALGIDGES